MKNKANKTTNNLSIYTYPTFGYGHRYYDRVNNIINWKTLPKRLYYSNSLSGVVYHNDWVLVQMGQGTENWGAGDNIQLALNHNSRPYKYLKIGSDYGNIRVCYIHGYLETTADNFNRYITARGIEWTNKKSLIISFHEIVIYSGKNRLIDIGYLNPMSLHLETEWNGRLNFPGEGNSNAVWQVSFDYLINDNLRFSSNVLYDDYVFDKNIERDMQNASASSYKINKLIENREYNINIYSTYIRVGSPTFRHNKYNNFVVDGTPLGISYGSDFKEILIGINFIKRKEFYFLIELNKIASGERNILFNSYLPNLESNYLKSKFPSGEVQNSFVASLNASKRVYKKIAISFEIDWIVNYHQIYSAARFNFEI